MKRPVPARGSAPGPRRDAPPTTLRVRYYRRMKPQRVYPLLVEVPAVAAAAPGPLPVTLRPVVPGALVMPAEQRVDALRPGERFSFYVTPLARGRLPEPRVEVVQPGRPAQPIPLRMKGVTQRLTWLLLALTILVPLGIIYVTRVAPLRGDVPVTVHMPNVGPDKAQAAAGNAKAADQPGDADKNTPKPGDADKAAPKPGDADKAAPKPGDAEKKEPRPEGKQDQGEKPAGAEAPAPVTPPEAGEQTRWLPGSPGAVLTHRLNTELNSALPAATDVLPSDAVAKPVKDAWDVAAPAATEGIGLAYDILYNAPSSWFWVGLALLGLTILSWLVHRASRASRRAALHLTPGGAAVPAHDDTRPLAVEPA